MKKRMLTRIAMVVSLLIAVVGCKKYEDHIIVPPPADPVDTVDVKLKQLTITNLPSPYYHFIYDEDGFATGINYSSNFVKYVLSYANKRVIKMIDTRTEDSLIYSYTGPDVTAVDVYSGITGMRQWHHDLFYDQQHRLTKVIWFIIPATGQPPVAERMSELHHGSDGNLRVLKNYYADGSGQLPLGSTTFYEDFDNKVNVDQFGILKSVFDHLLYLPNVKLQKNNPRKTRINGTVNDYEVSNSFTYTGNVPQVKTTTTKRTRGDNVGLVTTSTTAYEYY